MSYQVPDEKLYNLSMIQEIAHGNMDFVNKMMALFIDTMPPAINELKSSMASGDWSNVGAVAHKIKPSIDTMGIEILKEDIRAVEKYGKEASNLDLIPDLMDKVDKVIAKIISDLQSELNQ
jgi:HPt (histidine-containing phosphotransfer) domain-containing protein